jgi:phosphonate transport system substrate-binding protein
MLSAGPSRSFFSFRHVLLCTLLLAIAGGCAQADQPIEQKTPAPKKGQKLLIGLVPEQSLFKQMDRYEPLARYLGRKTGVTIELSILPHYGDSISTFVSAGMDGAFFGSFTYVLAHAKLGGEVLVRPEDTDGVSTYHGLLFVRKDSGIRTVEQMAGKRFAFVDKATTAGYLLPLSYFQRHGKNYNTFLREFYFAGTHEDVIYDVLNGKADIGAAKDTVFNRLARSDARLREELLVLAVSPEVPENALAVRKDLDRSLRALLQDALLSMDSDPEGAKVLKTFGARRFILTRNSDYAEVYRYAQELRLNLAGYAYLND